jgi:hypothetical protein
MLRIIDNKRIKLTESEFKLYQEICKSYDGPKMKGADLFKDLFETDNNGIIIFLRPPNKTYTSMEVYLFIVNIMIHQHLGQACDHTYDVIKEAKETILEAKQLINELKKSRDQQV